MISLVRPSQFFFSKWSNIRQQSPPSQGIVDQWSGALSSKEKVHLFCYSL
jgi:hypothetical protein